MADPTIPQVQDVSGLAATTQGIASAIAVAVLMANEVMAGSGLSVATTDNIKLYLACHIATLSQEKGPHQEIKVGEGLDRFHNIYAAGLLGTRFGQMAIALDTTGRLGAIASGVTKPTLSARFTHIETSQQWPEDEDWILP
jgi:hypothetical protein